MPKASLILAICLLFLLPLSLTAQDATATAPATNCPNATEESSLVSGLFKAEIIAPTELDWYYFTVNESEIWRFDLSSIHPLVFDIYAPDGYGLILSVAAHPQGIVSTAFRSYTSGVFCLRTSNQGEVNMDYNIRLTILEDEEGRMPRAEDLTTSDGYNVVGDFYYERGNYESGFFYYDLAIDRNAGDSLAWSNRCATYYQLGFYDDAVRDCSEALNIDPSSRDALWFRAGAYETLGIYGPALNDFQSLANNNYDSAYFFALAANYMLLGDASSALANMEQFYNGSNLATKGYWRGLARFYAADYLGAIADFETYIAQAPGYPYNVYFMLGMSHRALGNQAEMEAAFATAGELLRLEENLVSKHRWIALSLLVGGDASAARIHYREIIQIEPYAHQRRTDFLYLAVLAHVFPDEPIYSETFFWLREEVGIE